MKTESGKQDHIDWLCSARALELTNILVRNWLCCGHVEGCKTNSQRRVYSFIMFKRTEQQSPAYDRKKV